MKLNKHIPVKYSSAFLVLIFVIGLAVVGWLDYIFNIQYQPSRGAFSNGPVTTPPKTLRLTLDQPEDDSLTFQKTLLISGKTSPGKEVLIFTNSQNLVIKSKNDGSFSVVYDLDEGVNNITTVVFDINGDSKTQERIVYYSKEQL